MPTIENTKNVEEARIQALMENWAKALRMKNPDAMTSHCTRDFVAYDGMPPLQIGENEFKKNWEEYFVWFPGDADVQMRNLKIKAGEDTAFAHGLVYLKSTNAEGQEEGAWMRLTACYEKVDGDWQVAHEHWSMPSDMETGKVRADLKP